MTQDQFKTQINRLVSNFGKSFFSEERLNLIWQEVKDFEGSWLEKVCSDFIGEMRQAPMVADFREACSKERERTWTKEKVVNKRDAEFAMKQIYDSQIIGSICKNISDKMDGKITQENYTKFIDDISRIGAKSNCSKCDDSGLVFLKDDSGNDCVYRCFCVSGNQKPKAYPQLERTLREVR